LNKGGRYMFWKLLSLFLITTVCTLFITDYFIRKFKSRGYTVLDMYKRPKRKVANMGGLAIICGLMIALVFCQIFVDEINLMKLLVFYFVVLLFGIFGLVDDLIVLGRKIKIFAPYFMALPIALLNVDTNVSLILVTIELGLVFSYLIAPIYVMVTSNLINMHSGFNGLASGLSLILLGFIGGKMIIRGQIDALFYIVPIFAATLAFYWFEKYKSKIFWGNTGSLMLGAAIGGSLVLFDMETFGVIILLPHIINFIMWVYWCFRMKKHPHVKFAAVRKDGTIDPPNGLTIKYLVTKMFKMNEQHATWVCYGVTMVFGVLGLTLF